MNALRAVYLRRSLCFALALSASTTAQEAPKPDKAHALFAKEAGTWDCDIKMFFKGPDGPPTESKGVEVNQLVSGDLYLQTSFTYPMRNRQFEGHALMGYDPRSKTYIGTWVDNFTTIPSLHKGEYSETAQTLTVRSTVADAKGRELKQKQVTTWIDDSKKKLEIFLVIDAGGKEMEIKLMESLATKRK